MMVWELVLPFVCIRTGTSDSAGRSLFFFSPVFYLIFPWHLAPTGGQSSHKSCSSKEPAEEQ